ncbi:MAG: hypothetical protein EXS36_15355 [Pedosphaera sp.]|nr:hypothetical protein [Pedosphaera sp.]
MQGNANDKDQGKPAALGESTWKLRGIGNAAWGSPGGKSGTDYQGAVSGKISLGGEGDYSVSSAGLKADVETWLSNPAQNIGWILISDTETTRQSTRRIASRERATGAPQLTIEYTAGSVSVPPVLSARAESAGIVVLSFKAESGVAYVVEGRSALATGDWSTARVINSKPTGGTATMTEVAGDVSRFYRVRVLPGNSR